MTDYNLKELVNLLSESSKADDAVDSNKRKSSDILHGIETKKLKTNGIEHEASPDFGCVDVKRLEYGTRNLQKSIRLILTESPDFNELQEMVNSSRLDENTRLDLQQNKLINLSAKIKSKYHSGELGIFDSIVDNDINLSEKDLSSNLNHKAPEKRTASAAIVTTSAEPSQNEGYPPLPQIKDPYLYQRVFIHKSTMNNKSYLNPYELINSHNERLEFLGDSILNNLVTLIIYNRFPEASEGELSKIRSSLINNSILTEFSIEYGFDKKLRSNINESILRQGKQKIYADIFEAYIGALTIERGSDFTEIKNWLSKLMELKLRKFDKEFEKLEPVNKDAKSELYSLIGTAAYHPTYETVQHGDGAEKPYIIQCKMGEDILGEGVAPGHKDAGLRAAMEALKNKPMLEKYSQYRSTLDRSETVISNKSKTQLATLAASASPSFSISSIDKSLFPVIADESVSLQPDAKNVLYATIGKTIGEIPEYSTFEVGDKKIRTDLKIQGFIVATAVDQSKKKSMTRAAMALLNNKEALNEIIKPLNNSNS